MKDTLLAIRRLGALFGMVFFMSLVACAGVVPTQTYTVMADSRTDDQNAYFLDYRYFHGSTILVEAPDYQVSRGDELVGTSIYGPMAIGTSLYAKWIDKSSGKIYEDTANLVGKLKGDINGKRIYFMIRGSQMYVYLISHETRSEGTSLIGPKYLDNHYITQLYPDGSGKQMAKEVKK